MSNQDTNPMTIPKKYVHRTKVVKSEVLEVESIPAPVPKKKFFIRPKVKPYKALTLGEEVDSLVREWYAARGEEVPPEDIVGAQIDAAQAAEDARIEAAASTAAETIPDVAPAYGTPEFWAYHRAKKAAENERRAAEGLPPLPTKKELEAEKAKKAAERLSKKAEKEKAAADKLNKKASKV